MLYLNFYKGGIMSGKRRLSVMFLCSAVFLFLSCRAKPDTENYWLKMRTIMQGGGNDFEPVDKAAEYAGTLSFEQLSLLDSQSFSDTELQRQTTEQEFEFIAAMVYTKYFENKKISFDDFLNDMTVNKRRHTAMWTYMCLTSTLPGQEVGKLDAAKAEKLYAVLKTQAMDPQAKVMATSSLLAMIVSIVKNVPSLNGKLPETADMLLQTLLKFGESKSEISEESAGLAADQFRELKPLIDRDPKFKETFKANLAGAASKSSIEKLKSLLLSLASSL